MGYNLAAAITQFEFYVINYHWSVMYNGHRTSYYPLDVSFDSIVPHCDFDSIVALYSSNGNKPR